ncbi:MAG: hypothetical protein Q4C04_07935 [Clostridia bacterium]|nr:hypothetical protein [Clostridia bacterium]
MKRCLALLLTALLLFTFAPAASFGVEQYYIQGAVLQTEGLELTDDGLIAVPFTLEGFAQGQKFLSVQFFVDYNPNNLELVRCDADPLTELNALGSTVEVHPEINDIATETGRQFRYAIAGSSGLSFNEEPLLVLYFRVADGLRYGTQLNLELSGLELSLIPAEEGGLPVSFDGFFGENGSITINPRAKFYDGETLVHSVGYNLGDTSVTEPEVPQHAGYICSWPESYELPINGAVINLIKDPITYVATFVDENNQTVGTVDFTLDDTVEEVLAKAPAVPKKAGYIGNWETFELKAENITVAPVYTRGLYGDADCSGEIAAADAAAVLRFTVRLQDLSELGRLQGDVTAPYDGSPNSADAAQILRWCVRLITEFPIEAED